MVTLYQCLLQAVVFHSDKKTLLSTSVFSAFWLKGILRHSKSSTCRKNIRNSYKYLKYYYFSNFCQTQTPARHKSVLKCLCLSVYSLYSLHDILGIVKGFVLYSLSIKMFYLNCKHKLEEFLKSQIHGKTYFYIYIFVMWRYKKL